jgi:hypothetical protein
MFVSRAGHYSWQLSPLLALPLALGFVVLWRYSETLDPVNYVYVLPLCWALGEHQAGAGGAGVGLLCLIFALGCLFYSNREGAAAFLWSGLLAGAVALIASVAGA